MSAITQPEQSHAVKWTWGQYQNYLQSVEWTMLRARALSLHGTHCQVCRRDATQLHHLLYREYPQDSIPEDLMPVCKDCHRRIHEAFSVPMDRMLVIQFFARRPKKLIVIDKEWRKKASKTHTNARSKPLTRKQARAAVREAKRAQKARNAKWEERWAWVIKRHPELYGRKK